MVRYHLILSLGEGVVSRGEVLYVYDVSVPIYLIADAYSCDLPHTPHATHTKVCATQDHASLQLLVPCVLSGSGFAPPGASKHTKGSCPSEGSRPPL